MSKKQKDSDSLRIDSIVGEARRERKVTFTIRVDPVVLENFKRTAETKGLKPGALLESFMKAFSGRTPKLNAF